MWKKQDEGPPTLPPGTPNEVKEGLATISTNAFERQVRSVLISMNERGEGEDEGDGPNLDPPSSFPVEAVHQVIGKYLASLPGRVLLLSFKLNLWGVFFTIFLPARAFRCSFTTGAIDLSTSVRPEPSN